MYSTSIIIIIIIITTLSVYNGLYLECFAAMAESGCSYDLINVSGPLTVETILRTLQQRFNDGHCYVSWPYSRFLRPFRFDMLASLFIFQTWMGPVLLCVNPFEAPSAVTLSILRQLVQQLLSGLAEGSERHRSVALVFSGVCGSGKSFTADQLLLKVFQTVQKTDWLQDLRKYWQVSSVVLKALGSAATQSNRDSSRIVRDLQLGRFRCHECCSPFVGSYGGFSL